MVEKIDQKKCRDISIEIQETLAKWGKYFFYYYPKDGLANGIVYISEDRKRDGLVLGMSVKENMSPMCSERKVTVFLRELQSLFVGILSLHTVIIYH